MHSVVCTGSLVCNVILSVLSSFTIILISKSELFAVILIVLLLFVAFCVFVSFPQHHGLAFGL